MNRIMQTLIAAIAATACAFAFADDADEMVSGSGPASYVSYTVETVRSSAFANVTAVTNIALDAATGIGNGVFVNCRALKTVSLASLADVSHLSGAFVGCAALENVYLPQVSFAPGTLAGFPWGVPATCAVKFHFANGVFDRRGREVAE